MSVTPCLWFNGNAEEAVSFYVSLVPNSRIVETARHEGKALMIVFDLDGVRYQALNGPMDFPFSEAVSLIVTCDTQADLDRIWDRLGDGGKPQMCGWIKDRYGLPWQVVPSRIGAWMKGDPAAAGRVMQALLQMVKLDIPTLERAYRGETTHA